MKSIFQKEKTSFGYAFKGLRAAFSSEKHLKFHVFAAILVVGFGLYFSITVLEWLILLLFITLVIFAELINTALEKLTDLASPGFHPLAEKAKDIAAGAVLWCAMAAVVAGLIIFIPKMF